MQLAQERSRDDSGFAMAGLLVAMAVMAILMSALLPVWRTLSIRESEEELVWRGRQYDRAIQLYRKKTAAPGAPNVDALIRGRFLRQKYSDPITDGDFEYVGVNPAAGNAPGVQQPKIGFGQLIGGVRSKSKARSMRALGRTHDLQRMAVHLRPLETCRAADPSRHEPRCVSCAASGAAALRISDGVWIIEYRLLIRQPAHHASLKAPLYMRTASTIASWTSGRRRARPSLGSSGLFGCTRFVSSTT